MLDELSGGDSPDARHEVPMITLSHNPIKINTISGINRALKNPFREPCDNLQIRQTLQQPILTHKWRENRWLSKTSSIRMQTRTDYMSLAKYILQVATRQSRHQKQESPTQHQISRGFWWFVQLFMISWKVDLIPIGFQDFQVHVWPVWLNLQLKFIYFFNGIN